MKKIIQIVQKFLQNPTPILSQQQQRMLDDVRIKVATLAADLRQKSEHAQRFPLSHPDHVRGDYVPKEKRSANEYYLIKAYIDGTWILVYRTGDRESDSEELVLYSNSFYHRNCIDGTYRLTTPKSYSMKCTVINSQGRASICRLFDKGEYTGTVRFETSKKTALQYLSGMLYKVDEWLDSIQILEPV